MITSPLRCRPLVWIVLCCCWLSNTTWASSIPELANYPGAEAGLVVQVAPPSLDDAIALARSGSYLVAVLEPDPTVVAMRNQALVAAGVYPVAQCHPWWFTTRLPFRTRSVNVIVLRQGLEPALAAEAERIAVPGSGLILTETSDGWRPNRPPRPAGMSTWTGFAADGGNSFYSPDKLLNTVNSVHFFHGGQRLRRTHPFVADERIQVQAFSKLLEGRDAFSGLLRWRKTVGDIESNIGLLAGGNFWWLEVDRSTKDGVLRRVDRLTGEEAQSINIGPIVRFAGQDHDAMSRYYRVVTDGDTIYATGGGQHQIMAFDARTGTDRWQLEVSEFVEFLAVSDGLLVAQLSSTDNSPYECGFGWNCNVSAGIIGIDSKTGHIRWRNDDTKDHPSHNLLVDAEKVVACSFLPDHGKLEKRADWEWYEPRLYLQVIERESGRTRFMRTNFDDIRCKNSIQIAATWPGRIGVMKDNDLAIFDAADGSIIEQYAGPGYHLCYPAVSDTHFWTGNSAVPLDDPQALDRSGFDLAFPAYGHRNAIANGMLYSPNRLDSVNSQISLGSASALIFRSEAERQTLPIADPRRHIFKGTATWSAATAADWPTFRGNAERTGWLSGQAPVPVGLAWSAITTSLVDAKASGLRRSGWETDGVMAGKITQPVADSEHVLVGLPHEHRLICYDAVSSTERWSRQLDGRFGTAPTLAGDTAFIGCDDGMVYAINLGDGSISWQFFAGAGGDLIFDHDQIANLYRVTSSPILHQGALFVSAGRHTSLEEGILVWKLDPATGQVLDHVQLDAEWVGPEERKRMGPAHPLSRSRGNVNDLLELRAGQLCLVRTIIDPATLVADPGPHGLIVAPGAVSTAWSTRDFPCCASTHSYACRHHYPGRCNGCDHRSLRPYRRPSPLLWRVGICIRDFGACSVFTHVAARAHR